MQVNLLENMPIQAGDSTTKRSEQQDDPNVGGPFIVQMNHACKLANKKDDVSAEEVPVHQLSIHAEEGKRKRVFAESMSESVLLHARNITDSNGMPSEFVMPHRENLTDASTLAEGNININPDAVTAPETSTITTNVMKQIIPESKDSAGSQAQLPNRAENPSKPDPAIDVAPKTPGPMDSTSQKAAIEVVDSQNADDVSGRARQAGSTVDFVISSNLRGWVSKPDSSNRVFLNTSEFVADAPLTRYPAVRQPAEFEDPSLPANLAASSNSDSQRDNTDEAVLRNTEKIMTAAFKHGDAVGLLRDQPAVNKESVSRTAPDGVMETAQIEKDASRTILLQGPDASTFRSELSPATKSLGPASDSFEARDADEDNVGPRTVVSRKSDAASPGTFNSTDARGSGADQDSNSGHSATSASPQFKWDGSQLTWGRSQVSFAGRQPETPAASAAGSVHPLDSGVLSTSGTERQAAARSENFLFQLADEIQMQFRNGRDEIRIQLQPESLGRLEIRAETTNMGVVARIAAESGDVKTYLENNLPLLHQALQNQGLKIDRIQVFFQNGFDFQSSPGFTPHSGHTGSGHDGAGTSGSLKMSGSPFQAQGEEAASGPANWISLNPNISFYTIA